MNEKIATVIFALFTAGLLYFAPGMLEVKDIVLLKLTYIALFLGATFGLLHFLRGTKTDVLDKVFEEENGAVALLVTGFMIALALVIGK